MVSKIRNFLPNVPNRKKIGGVAHHNQQHEKQKYFLSAAIPFKFRPAAFESFYLIVSKDTARTTNLSFTEIGKDRVK